MSGFEISPSHVGTLSILTLIHTYHQSLSTLIRLSEVRHLLQSRQSQSPHALPLSLVASAASGSGEYILRHCKTRAWTRCIRLPIYERVAASLASLYNVIPVAMLILDAEKRPWSFPTDFADRKSKRGDSRMLQLLRNSKVEDPACEFPSPQGSKHPDAGVGGSEDDESAANWESLVSAVDAQGNGEGHVPTDALQSTPYTGQQSQKAQHARVGRVASFRTVPSPCVEAEKQRNTL
ncbi:hypothetical protein T440DRAFT_484442 [Plenodomus tracheiphilus IPT5]|uniref:Uncharacterized protein n=1 Tax=Plenodomus tracheiphilus IPT5 TaxID=1408161 RepID=A0A6A7AN31_9PLEO|nr:hypothetical protein T440DRAFT_484442 [Plenodomus tracheiphilus IPT5]